jgi:hypothetical protein
MCFLFGEKFRASVLLSLSLSLISSHPVVDKHRNFQDDCTLYEERAGERKRNEEIEGEIEVDCCVLQKFICSPCA